MEGNALTKENRQWKGSNLGGLKRGVFCDPQRGPKEKGGQNVHFGGVENTIPTKLRLFWGVVFAKNVSGRRFYLQCHTNGQRTPPSQQVS